MKRVLPLLIVLVLLSAMVACGGEDDPKSGGATNPIALVPQKANLIGLADIERVFEEVDFSQWEGMISEEEGEEDGQSFQEGLDAFKKLNLQEGLLFFDLSDIGGDDESALVPEIPEMGDVGSFDGYLGIIVTGDFKEDEVIQTIESVADEPLDAETTTYKGVVLYVDESDEFAIAFPADGLCVIGSLFAVKDVIDIKEGDESPLKGEVLTTYNGLGTALFKLAMEIPSGLMEESFESEEDEMGVPPAFLDMETLALAVDKEGDVFSATMRLCFTNEESATDTKGFLNLILGMMGIEDIKMSVEGLCVNMSMEATPEMLKDLMKDFEGSESEPEEPGFSPSLWSEG